MKGNTGEVNLYAIEKRLWSENYERIMGLDEVGRGCLAGPVVAAGVILKPNTKIPEINDSKQLSLPKREELSNEVQKKALCWHIDYCSTDEIADLNILWASLRAMEKCVENADLTPDYLLIDGNRYVDTLIPHTCVVKGDARSASIAAASILAKVHRDKLMISLHDEYPDYGWNTNVGYPTKQHYSALKENGYSPHHRRSFNLKTDKKLKT